MSTIAAPHGNPGILPQVHVVRALPLSPPVAAPADRILAAVADALRRDGNEVVRVRGGRVEFYDDDPPAFLLELRGPRLPVVGGVVAPDPRGPWQRVRLELWMSPCLYLEPLALTALVLVAPMLPTTKTVLLVILLGLAWMQFLTARDAFEARIVDAVRRASPA
ncbi:hypothetical protein [Longimicrobium sp.]|uniref:hypothetical protein n=1 Tax=Longimicrobium sp. TaxID=2029185 RepID=UPI002CCC57CE|nr:hypothetical protein [Longimicrobium sp.]HSU12582.1 hypothetical protein [Longimicrobium sp.]